MSAKPILIVVHGMGDNKEESFRKKVIDAANTALNRYEGYENQKFENLVDVKPVSYNFIFEKVRDRIDKANQPIADFLRANGDIDAAPSIIQKASDMQEKLGKDEFLTTHVLDVLLYLTNVGEWVRAEVTQKIVNIVDENPNTPINFLAHSLGTGVLHDSLSKVMRTDAPVGAPSLDPNKIKFNMVWMFANVSQFLANYTGQTHPYKSIVKPGDSGCLRVFINVRHILDPFTRPMMFDPQPSDKWVRPYVYNNDYFNLITTAVSRKDTHDIAGYLEDPVVTIPFLRTMVNFKASDEVISKGNKKFKSIGGEYEKLEEEFKSIDKLSDLKDYLQLLKDFRDYVKEFNSD